MTTLGTVRHPYRVLHDAEGFAFIPGRYGRVEEHDGRELAVYSDHPRVFDAVLAIPGVRRHQIGDDEIRVLFPIAALDAVARVIRARRRRRLDAERAREIGSRTAHRTTSRAVERTISEAAR